MGDTTLVQLRIPGDLLSRIDEAAEGSTRTAWLLAAAERELDDSGPEIANALGGLAITQDVQPGGIPSPGVACSWPECWARDTHRYGVTDPGELTRGGYRDRPRDAEKCGLTLCPSHAAKLNGFRYVRPREVTRSAGRQPEPV